MLELRSPAVAGAFYPDQPQQLRQAVRSLLDRARAPAGAHVPKALIVPHAGYIYSGEIAAAGYAQIAPARATLRRVVLLGPAHRHPVRGLALPESTGFETPLGAVPVDERAVALIRDLPQVEISEAAHALEHSLEVQLPFLQAVLDDFAIVPLAVGDATPAEVAEVLEILWGGPETLIVISSDLSHYLPYRAAQTTDDDTINRVLRLEGPIGHGQACGGTPISGLLLAATRHALQPRLLDLRNSGDTAGDKRRVVGYASLAFDEVGRAR